MKHTFFLMAAACLLLMTQCKPAEKPMEEPIPSVSYMAGVVDHTISDYAKWFPGYEAHDSVRQAYGIHSRYVGRGLEDSNRVITIHRVDDLAKANEFLAMPELKTLMDSAGVTGQPVFHMINVVRNDDSPTDNKDRLFVAHKVKDYAAWLKVYDREGKSKRAEHGLIDRGLGRGVEDSNMVYIVFAVTDMAKVQARMQSEEFKQLITEAGVEGEPNAVAYRIVKEY